MRWTCLDTIYIYISLHIENWRIHTWWDSIHASRHRFIHRYLFFGSLPFDFPFIQHRFESKYFRFTFLPLHLRLFEFSRFFEFSRLFEFLVPFEFLIPSDTSIRDYYSERLSKKIPFRSLPLTNWTSSWWHRVTIGTTDKQCLCYSLCFGKVAWKVTWKVINRSWHVWWWNTWKWCHGDWYIVHRSVQVIWTNWWDWDSGWSELMWNWSQSTNTRIQ